MDHEKGPATIIEARQFLADIIIEALQKENIKYIWYHHEDWTKLPKSRFDKAQEECIIRVKKWANLKQ